MRMRGERCRQQTTHLFSWRNRDGWRSFEQFLPIGSFLLCKSVMRVLDLVICSGRMHVNEIWMNEHTPVRMDLRLF